MPVHTPTLPLSGYADAAGWITGENMRIRTAASVSLRSSCAPSGPVGKNATSNGASRSMPAGVRRDGAPASTSTHSSSAYS